MDSCSTRIIHEYRRKTVETEAPLGCSQAKPTQIYLQSVEEAEREQPRWERGRLSQQIAMNSSR